PWFWDERGRTGGLLDTGENGCGQGRSDRSTHEQGRDAERRGDRGCPERIYWIALRRTIRGLHLEGDRGVLKRPTSNSAAFCEPLYPLPAPKSSFNKRSVSESWRGPWLSAGNFLVKRSHRSPIGSVSDSERTRY